LSRPIRRLGPPASTAPATRHPAIIASTIVPVPTVPPGFAAAPP
jgi:hypothetical protein